MAYSEYKIGINRLKVCYGVLMSTLHDSYAIKSQILLRLCLLRLEYLNNGRETTRRNNSTMTEQDKLDKGRNRKNKKIKSSHKCCVPRKSEQNQEA